MPAPTISLTPSGTAPDETVTREALVTQVNAALATLDAADTAEAAARAAQAQAALVNLAAATLTASMSGATLTVSWAQLVGRLGGDLIEVADATDLVVAGGRYVTITLPGSSPFTPTVEADSSGLRQAINAGTKLSLIYNRQGGLSGVLAPQVQAALVAGTVIAAVPESTILGRASAGSGPQESLTPAQARAVIGLDQVDNTADADKPISAAAALRLDRPVLGGRWIGGEIAADGTPLRLYDAAGVQAVPEILLGRQFPGRWVGGTKDAGGRVLTGLSADGEFFALPSAEMAEAISRALAARAEPPLSAAHVLAETTQTVGAHSVRFVTAERGGRTRLHTQRTDIASDTMILHDAGPLEFVAASGQSNSVGGGGSVGGGVFTPAPQHPAEVLMFNSGARGSGGDTIPGGALADFVPLFEVEVNPQGETQGAGALAWDLRWRRVAGLPPRAAVFRSHGQGGTAIADLSPGSQPYANGLAEITAAVSVAARYGRTVRARRVFWDQGEADRNTLTEAQYRDALIALADAYQADWRAITGQAEDVHLYVSQLAGSTGGGAGNASLGQYLAAKASARVHISTPNYLFGYADTVHKAPREHAHCGEYQARAALVREATGSWTGLRPATVSRTGAVITVVFDVPEGALEFSTDLLPAAPHWGFYYTDDSDSAAIASVAITAADTVTVTLTNAPAGANPVLSYAHNAGMPNTSGRSREWGNLVSPSAHPSFVYPTRNLDHYCQIFREAV